ncbi:MAG: hypothetical protein AAGA56_05030 [Myxococcota bacterium]
MLLLKPAQPTLWRVALGAFLLALAGCRPAPKEAEGPPLSAGCREASGPRKQAELVYARGELYQAMFLWTRASELCPNSKDTMRLIEVATELGAYSKARASLAASSLPAAWSRAANARLERLDRRQPRTRAAMGPALKAYEKALDALSNDRFEVAERGFLAAWRAWRPHGPALAGAARAATAQGKSVAARRYWDRAVVELEREHERDVAPLIRDEVFDVDLEAPTWSADGRHLALRGHLVHAPTLTLEQRVSTAMATRGSWLVTRERSGPEPRLKLIHRPSGLIVSERRVIAPGFSGLAVSEDGASIAINRREGGIEIWREGRGRIELPDAGPPSVTKSRPPTGLLFIGRDSLLTYPIHPPESRVATLWDLASRRVSRRWGEARRVAFSADHRIVTIEDRTGTFTLDVERGEVKEASASPPSVKQSRPLGPLPEGAWGQPLYSRTPVGPVYGALDDRTLVVSSPRGSRRLALNDAHDLVGIAFDPRARRIAALTGTGTLWLYTLADGGVQRLPPTGRKRTCLPYQAPQVAFARNGTQLLVHCRQDEPLDVVDLDTGRYLEPVAAPDTKDWGALTVSRDGRFVVAGRGELAADLVGRRLLGPGAPDLRARFHCDLVGCTASDNLRQIRSIVPAGAVVVAMSADDGRLAWMEGDFVDDEFEDAASDLRAETTVVVAEMATERRLFRVRGEPGDRYALSPRGKSLARLPGFPGPIELWDIATEKRIALNRSLDADAAFLGDGVMAFASVDGSLDFVRTDGMRLATLRVPDEAPAYLVFADGTVNEIEQRPPQLQCQVGHVVLPWAACRSRLRTDRLIP